MAPLLLDSKFIVPPRTKPHVPGTAEWDYDTILDGLLSGKISGQPMNAQDARLLLTLLKRLGWIPDAKNLVNAMPYFIGKLGMDDLRNLMCNLGFRAKQQKLRGANLPRGATVSVIEGPDGRMWAVDTEQPKTPKTTRPGTNEGDVETHPVRLSKIYTFLQFEPNFQPIGSEKRIAPSSFTTDTFSRFAPDLRLALVLTLLSGVLTVLFSVLVIFLFDLVVTGQQTHVISAVLILAGGFFLFDVGFRTLKARILGRISGRFEYLLGGALFGKLLKLPRKMIDQAPISEQTGRLRELEGIRDLFAGPFTIVTLELPGTLLLIGAITVFSPVLGLLLLGMILLFLLAGLTLVPSMVRRAAALSAARSNLNRLQLELVEKRHQIARNGLAWPWAKKAENAIGAVVAARFGFSKVASRLEALSYLFLPAAAGSIIFVGAERAIAGRISGGELVAVTMMTWRAVSPIQQGLLIIPKIGDLLRLFRQIDAMMRFAEEDNPVDVEKIKPKPAKLRADNLFLRGPQSHIPTLAGVSLEIPEGMFVSVTGASGSGKTSLLMALSGQIQPQAGTVQIDGVNLSEMSSHALCRRIMLVSNRPLLIYGSLAQNLRLVDPLVSDERISALLCEVGLAWLIETLPEGIHTRFDPAVDDALLAGGVRTAVAVAQAILMEPSILLLDEASEDLNPDLEDAIHAALKRRTHKTSCLVATHRPSIMRTSDAVLRIAGGRTNLEFNEEKKDKAV